MAEAIAILGAVSSATQIVSSASQFVVQVHKLIESSKSSAKDDNVAKSMAVEYERVSASVKNVQLDFSELHGLDEEDQDVLRLSEQCATAAKDLRKVIEESMIQSTSRGWSLVKEAARKAAKHNKTKTKCTELRSRLEELMGLLSTAIRNAERKYRPLETLLNDLHFDGMHFREAAISDVRHNTYEWALSEDHSGFKTWLQHGNDLFWITGKPGSGKSTFMKFLSRNPQTAQHLDHWCAGSRLFVVDFFFWYLGSPLQKSLEGLLRSILHQFLCKVKDLAPIAFPEYYPRDDDNKGSKRIRNALTVDHKFWTQGELELALRRIIEWGGTIASDKKICFFIDGLDEYSGDHIGLTKLLIDLSTYGDVKLCVASRPWNAFDNAFVSRYPNLRLENITEPDIRKCVYGTIRALYTSASSLYTRTTYNRAVTLDDLQALIDEVVERAEGVFLWVHLVLLQIERGFAEGDKIKMLLQRIRQFPPDLEMFFQKLIFDRVDKVYTRQTCQALFLTYRYATHEAAHFTHSFIDFWLMSQSPEGLPATCDTRLWQNLHVSMNSANTRTMIEDTRKFLSASCKDLLVLTENPKWAARGRVGFLHRTVFDFLTTDRMYGAITANSPPMFAENERIFHMLGLAKVMIFRADGIPHFVREIAQFCLFRPHQDLTLDFVQEFWSAIQASSNRIRERITPMVIGTFVALHQYEAMRDALSTAGNDYSNATGALTSEDICSRRIWIAAAMGEHSGRRFSFREINLSVLEELIKSSDVTDIFEPTALVEDTGSVDLWQFFKLKLEFQDARKEHIPVEEHEAIQRVKELLLRYRPFTDSIDGTPGQTVCQDKISNPDALFEKFTGTLSLLLPSPR